MSFGETCQFLQISVIESYTSNQINLSLLSVSSFRPKSIAAINAELLHLIECLCILQFIVTSLSLRVPYFRLHDNCSSTQQTNNLLEQKLHSVVRIKAFLCVLSVRLTHQKHENDYKNWFDDMQNFFFPAVKSYENWQV